MSFGRKESWRLAGRKGARAEGALVAACSVLGSRGAGVGLVGGGLFWLQHLEGSGGRELNSRT